jgi:hypothetical protein
MSTPTTETRLQINEPISKTALDGSFEGRLLFALLTDDDPVAMADDDSIYLGSKEFYGEGYLTFAGDIEDLARWIDAASSSNGVSARTLLPLLKAGYAKQFSDPNDYASFHFSNLTDQNGADCSISIFELIQDMMQQCDLHSQQYTVTCRDTESQEVISTVTITKDDIDVTFAIASPKV